MSVLLLDAATALTRAGCCVIPARPDGSKAPAVTWTKYQIDLPGDEQLASWFSNGMFDGLGVVCGRVSGGLEMLEFEGRAIGMVPELGQLMTDHGVDELWKRLLHGYVEMTPSGGLHFLYRVTDGPAKRNTKLARRPATADELAENPDDRVKVLLETRGQGGFTITAPSGGRTHPTGEAWRMIAGGPATIPTVTADERDELYAIAVMLDQMPADDPLPTFRGDPVPPPGGELRPGDDYNLRAQWDEILIPHGWQPTHKTFNSGGRCWTRPGKEHGISATTGTASDGVDRLYMFSSSTTFETERPYSKFGAYAHLNHGGDLSAAASALRHAGYGGQRPPTDTDITFKRGDVDRPFSSPESASPEEGTDTPPWWLNAINGTVLDSLTFPPLSYLVEKVLTAGSLTLLAGPPKAGKSYAALSIACAVAAGGMALDRLATEGPADVLMVSLDDQSRARAQRRLREIMQGPIPARLTLHTEPNLGVGRSAAESLTAYLTLHPETRLVVIDTLEHLRGRSMQGESAYSADVKFLSNLREVITAHPQISVFALAHTRKGEGDDPISAVSGTHGVTGGADAVLVLTGKRGAPRRLLDVIGRDAEDLRLVLKWTDHGLSLTDEDPDDPTHLMTEADAEVYRAVRDCGQPISARDLETIVDLPKIGNRLMKLTKEGFLRKEHRGLYVIT